MEAYIKRMLDEDKALRQKMHALEGFLSGKNTKGVPEKKLNLMYKQLKRMSQYHAVLEERIALETK